MTAILDPNKAKTARRVIEVLEFFDEKNRHATVKDIVRRYNRPQSSTSELLASLVEMGLLYKDRSSRSYSLTPRAAILGSLSQPNLVRDGSLSMLIDRLGGQSGLGIALIGMVGLNAQIFRWKAGSNALSVAAADRLCGGLQDRLCDSAGGLLRLSTLSPDRREGVIRRLNAEAPATAKFNHSEMRDRVQECGVHGYARSAAGFGTHAEMCAVLLPSDLDEPPMALGFIYEPSDNINVDALLAYLQRSVQGCLTNSGNEGWSTHVSSAA